MADSFASRRARGVRTWGACDVDEEAPEWSRGVDHVIREEGFQRTLGIVKHARVGSSTQRWWHELLPEQLSTWQRLLISLAERIKDGPEERRAGREAR